MNSLLQQRFIFIIQIYYTPYTTSHQFPLVLGCHVGPCYQSDDKKGEKYTYVALIEKC